jgi:hypothetical protein
MEKLTQAQSELDYSVTVNSAGLPDSSNGNAAERPSR